MIIYPLPASELDDRTLEEQIKNIGQVLCNVHHADWAKHVPIAKCWKPNVPLEPVLYNPYCKRPKPVQEWQRWAYECTANYDYLVKLGLACIQECYYRWNEPIPENTKYKYAEVIEWADKNRPVFNYYADEYIGLPTPFPLVMPQKYKHNHIAIIMDAIDGTDINAIESYRNCFRAKLVKRTTMWTRREKPQWLDL